MFTGGSTRTELKYGWRLAPVTETGTSGAAVSRRRVDGGIGVAAMPATILRAQIDAGVYDDDLYIADNLTKIDQDLWKQDWCYTTTFHAPEGHDRFTLAFDGISYRAEIWLNGVRVDRPGEVVGAYRRFEFDVSSHIAKGGENHLAVLLTPEQRTPGLVVTDIPTGGEPTGVDLADTWADWIPFQYLGDREAMQTFIPDKNSGITGRVWLTFGGAVTIRNPYVRTQLPLPRTDSADLTVFADIQNFSGRRVRATIAGRISREGTDAIMFDAQLELDAYQTTEFAVTPDNCAALRVVDPDLWWPYIWGDPALYHLELECYLDTDPGQMSDRAELDFGIRHITGHRDDTASQPQFPNPGSFYLQINGRDYLVRGGAYSPDLFFECNDPVRSRTIMDHAKDIGFNLLRWEGHFIDDGMLELADREGMPAMFGTMCCGAWERWTEWDDEDHRVAPASVRDVITSLRAHPAVVLWSNGSDGMPPSPVLDRYHRVIDESHWQNPVVDTVSTRNRDWSGIHMNGPYSWRAPAFWFSPDSEAARGSCAEEGNSEAIPLVASIRKMLPARDAWPINDMWSVHAGTSVNRLSGIQRVIERRMGRARDLEDFVRKAQIVQYESARAQMEAYAAMGWTAHKFTVYWMMNAPWPSFFGHVFDWWYGKGGTYFGLKKALRPLSVIFDHFAAGDRTEAGVHLVNQRRTDVTGLRVTVGVYRVDGELVGSQAITGLTAAASSSTEVLRLARPVDDDSAVHIIRATLADEDGNTIVDNTYWQARQDDVPDLRVIDGIFDAMKVRQHQWADLRVLAAMPPTALETTCQETTPDGDSLRQFVIRLHNPGRHLAFFVQIQLCDPRDGEELLPSQYEDNFVTVYPGESVVVKAEVAESVLARGIDPMVRAESR